MKRQLKTLFIIISSIYLTGCVHLVVPEIVSVFTGPEPRSCSLDRGSCFDLTVDGQLATPMSPQEQQNLVDRLTRQNPHYSTCASCGSNISRINWQISAPVKDGLEVELIPIESDYFGDAIASSHILLFPLNGQDLRATKEITTNPSVRVGGVPIVSTEFVLAQDTLPPGEYLIHVSARGSTRRRDQKYVHFTVDK